jgi:hypothetical protein
MNDFFTSLRSTTLFYWTQPKVTLASIGTMLIANLTLYSLCDYIRFDDGAVVVKGLVTLAAFITIYVAGVFAMLRKGASFPDDAFKLAWTVLMAWQIEVSLFVLNIFPALRFYSNIPLGPWATGAVYAAIGTGVMIWFTYMGAGNQPPTPRPGWPHLIMPAVVTFGLTMVLIAEFLMDDNLREYLLARTEHFDKLLRDFGNSISGGGSPTPTPTPTPTPAPPVP